MGKCDETGRLSGILRTRATMLRHKNPGGYNGLAANFEAAADLLESQSTEGTIMREALELIAEPDVLNPEFESIGIAEQALAAVSGTK